MMNIKIKDVQDALYELGVVTVERKTIATLINGRSVYEFKVWIEERPPPPSLGISVSDGIGIKDELT
jgi:hypothetical protein